MNPRCPECGLYELNDGSEDTLWTCECEIEDTPATPSASCPRCSPARCMCLKPNEPEARCPHGVISASECFTCVPLTPAWQEPTEPTSFEDARNAAEREYRLARNSGPYREQDFKAGADWGYGFGTTHYTASELEMAKHRAQEKRASLFGELVVKEEIDRLRAELKLAQEQREIWYQHRAREADERHADIEKLTTELSDMRERGKIAIQSIIKLGIARVKRRKKA